jgi:hypothetical protein
MSCLFDDDDAEELPDASLAWANKLIVGEPCANPEELAEREMQYRREGRPPILFDDGDGIWNVGTFASAMGVPANGLTLEMAEQWLIEQNAGR